MGKKKAKKRSKILDSGKNSVNIEFRDKKAKDREEYYKERAATQLKYALCFLAGIIVILLYAILILMRQQADVVHFLMERAVSTSGGHNILTGHPAEIALQIIEKI